MSSMEHQLDSDLPEKIAKEVVITKEENANSSQLVWFC